MRLKAFCEQDRENWILSGVRMVKLTGSLHLADNALPDFRFVLVEPIAKTQDLMKGDMTARITSYEVTSIIRNYAGICYTSERKRPRKVNKSAYASATLMNIPNRVFQVPGESEKNETYSNGR